MPTITRTITQTDLRLIQTVSSSTVHLSITESKNCCCGHSCGSMEKVSQLEWRCVTCEDVACPSGWCEAASVGLIPQHRTRWFPHHTVRDILARRVKIVPCVQRRALAAMQVGRGLHAGHLDTMGSVLRRMRCELRTNGPRGSSTCTPSKPWSGNAFMLTRESLEPP